MRPVLIVSHGQPSDPEPAAAEVAALARRIAALLPGRRVGSVTLAEPGGMARAVGDLGAGGMVYPLFMAGGWFARSHLPDMLTAAGGLDWQVLEPFGCDAGLHDLVIRRVAQAMAGNGEPSGKAEVILAAHGSFKSPAPSGIALHLARRIAAETGAGRVEAAFIDQSPQLADLRGFGCQAICLPYFAAAGDHVNRDIPAALTRAGFTGRLLAPIGLDPEVPALIARGIVSGVPVCQTVCRYRS